MDKQLTRSSKFISLVLRHQPDKFGLVLDEHGWARIDDLLAVAARAGLPLTHETLARIVAENDKQRFAISDDGQYIRARQGHSIAVDLQLTPREAPAQLFHGTADRFVESIREHGLQRRSRQYVHLSPDAATARMVGSRHGRPVVLTIDSAGMQRDGFRFFLSENGVWLVEAVPAIYISFPTA
jgi:putative RNA 2'-phosphotransferase